ncbi:glycosyltransferase [Microbacterium sp. P04]|uniref:glycosyltransferase n=1 Tax=Microbacterium sp. P04 TaxID=3366947 RepID=UPI0037458291
MTATETETRTDVIAQSTGRFTGTARCDVAVIVVTYNSGADLEGLLTSLRAEADDLRLRVIVVDNSSTDDTLDVAARHDDVLTLRTGGNLGYAAGINVAATRVRPGEDILVLNPDLRVQRGAVQRLRAVLHAHPEVGVVAPRILDDAGRTTDSLHNEPTVLRGWADAVMGPLWRSRPAPLTEWVRSPRAYRTARDVDWASGAALLIRSDVARRVGEWDERFFLYSEETDYCRRVREAGFRVRFEPTAVVSHRQGGSGSSAALDALLNVNRVRYRRKHAPRGAETYRAAALIGAALRATRSPRHRATVAFLARESRWEDLPHATWSPPVTAAPFASVIMPAHNEGAVIDRSLHHLAPLSAVGALDVHVVCNGCDDDTAARARSIPGVRVLELAEPSKTGALNAGDAGAVQWPRIYLDADIDLPSAAIPGLVRALQRDGVLGGRPPFEYDTLHSDPLVKAYYRARLRMPHMSQALWGAGVYALNERGHDRIGEFPAVTADDLFVDSRLADTEKAFPLTTPVRVRMPLTTGALVTVLRRARRGPDEQGVDQGRQTLRALARSVRGPLSLIDAGVFAAITLYVRRRAAAPSASWERDDSTRRHPAVPRAQHEKS